MRELDITFRERAGELNGGPSFDAFVARAGKNGNLGTTNAGRILQFGSDLLAEETLDLLGNIIEDTGPFQHALTRNPYPLFRTASDFQLGESVYLHVPESHAKWSANTIWAVEDGVPLDEEDVPASRGRIVVEKDSKFSYGIAPEWPALVPAGLYKIIQDRKSPTIPRIEQRRITNFATSYFQASFFDRQFLSENGYEFNNSAYRALRRFTLITPTRR